MSYKVQKLLSDNCASRLSHGILKESNRWDFFSMQVELIEHIELGDQKKIVYLLHFYDEIK